MTLTAEEKQAFVNHIRELLEIDVLNDEDRRAIYAVCMCACVREMHNTDKKEG